MTGTNESGKLWTKDFTNIIISTTLGAAGSIAGGFAMSFLVFEETASTFAAAIMIALRVIPGFIVPLFVAPLMDRLPRKPFLVGCDAAAALIYVLAGLWLRANEFVYIYYLLFSLLIATVGSFDELTYNSILPRIIPPGMEEKGYSVTSMLYPMLVVVMTPLSALLYKTIGVANILIIQGFLCAAASFTESRITVHEQIREGTDFSFSQWWSDIKETFYYLKKEKGLMAMTLYSSTSNGFFSGYEAIFVAFFSASPVLTIGMYSFFTVVECIGRTVGGTLMYKWKMPREKKYGFALFVYMFYDTMDGLLLWLPYPLMLVNRCFSGFLGIQSGTMRYAATQKYIPDSMRARINAFQSMAFLAFSAVLSLIVGYMGDIMDYRVVMTVCSLCCIAVCLLTIVRRKAYVKKIYMAEVMNENAV